jgi:hypothetical protein
MDIAISCRKLIVHATGGVVIDEREICRRGGGRVTEPIPMERAVKSSEGRALGDGCLPGTLAPLLWEYDFSQLSWEEDRDLIVSRILSVGNWDAIRWLMDRLGRAELRRWIEDRQGRGLDPQQLRFWELVLGLRHRQVTQWIKAGDGVWAGRRRA